MTSDKASEMRWASWRALDFELLNIAGNCFDIAPTPLFERSPEVTRAYSGEEIRGVLPPDKLLSW